MKHAGRHAHVRSRVELAAGRFHNDEELEEALRALIEATSHVRQTG